MKDILFINMPSAFEAYKGSRLNAAMQVYPILSYACLAAILRERGFGVSILDLGIEKEPYETLNKTLDELKPRFIGITSTTPLFFEVQGISKIIREKFGTNVTIIYGGPHASGLPEESLKTTEVDIVVVGEGEGTIVEIVEQKPLSDIKGICYKEGDKVISTPSRDLIKDLDSLPFPALDLYKLEKYRNPRFVSRGTPTVNLQTSRGCAWKCSYCNKNISGRFYRIKSPERVIDEIKHLIKLGAGEFRVVDDQFATDINRAKRICEMMIKENLHIPWNLGGGIRADRVDEEFLVLAKRAGCYQVGIGFESGDQDSLNSVDKALDLEDSIKCMKLIRKTGLESVGFFMLGLPSDTEESLKKTIDFAVKLMPDFGKVTITIPFPGSKLFDDYDRRGLIKSRDWTKYNLHNAGEIYQHPNLSHETLQKYYDLFYRKYYLNPRYITRRLIKSTLDRTLFQDIYYGLQTFFPKFFPGRLKNT